MKLFSKKDAPKKRVKNVWANGLTGQEFESLKKLDGLTLQEAIAVLKAEDLSFGQMNMKNGESAPVMVFKRGNQNLIISYSRAFVEQEAHENREELLAGEFHISTKQEHTDDDGNEIPAREIISFGFASDPDVDGLQSAYGEEVPEPTKQEEEE